MASNASATIPALSAQPSKAEEIEYIEAVTRSLPVDSYLYRILAGVATYATVQINNDHGIGLIEKIDYEQGRREKAEAYARKRDGYTDRALEENRKLSSENRHLSSIVSVLETEIAQLRAARENDQKWINHLLALQEVLQLEAHKRALADDMERTEKGIALARETLTANPQPTIPAEA